MRAVSTIKSADWQIALDNPGEVAVDDRDIAQCIRIILTTVPGSDPLRPEFGARIDKFLDRPMNVALPRLVAEIRRAVLRWEPRVTGIKPVIETIQAGWQSLRLQVEIRGGAPVDMRIDL